MSIRPRKSVPRPTGHDIGTRSSASPEAMLSIRDNGSSASRSILLMKVTIGMSRMPANFEQLARLALDALGGVDHHDGRVDGRERAVGILAEVGVARRIEQVEDNAAPLERHHGTRHRDAALLLDRHPVRPGASPLAARLDVTGKLNGAAEQQQLLGQRGLAGVRVRDDRERAPAGDLGVRLRRGAQGRCVLHPIFLRFDDGPGKPAPAGARAGHMISAARPKTRVAEREDDC